jgi:hypothetical protein
MFQGKACFKQTGKCHCLHGLYGEANEMDDKIAYLNANSSWKLPKPLGKVELPGFPVAALPNVIKDYVCAVGEQLQQSVDMPASAALAALSICVKGVYRIKGWDGWYEPLNLYSVIVADSGERKSALIALMTQPIIDFEREQEKRMLPIVRKSRLVQKGLERDVEKLQLSERKAKDKGALDEAIDKFLQFKVEALPRFLVNDATPESMVSIMQENNGCLAILSSEGSEVFDIAAGRYSKSGVNISLLLKGHSGDLVRVDRKGRDPEYIEKPCLAMLLAIQHGVLEEAAAKREFVQRGLMQRFLFCLPESKVGRRNVRPGAIPEECKAQYEKLLYKLLGDNLSSRGKEPLTLTLLDGAEKIFTLFLEELEYRLGEDLSSVKGFGSKLSGSVLRIAGILHAVGNWEDNAQRLAVSEKTMSAAIEIGSYYAEHGKAALNSVKTDSDVLNALYIVEKLKEKKVEEFTKSELLKFCRRFRTVAEADVPISLLEEYEYIKRCGSGKSGNNKKIATYSVNPYIHFQKSR